VLGPSNDMRRSRRPAGVYVRSMILNTLVGLECPSLEGLMSSKEHTAVRSRRRVSAGWAYLMHVECGVMVTPSCLLAYSKTYSLLVFRTEI